MKWNGWWTGACVTLGLFIYTGFINNHPGPLRPVGGGSYREGDPIVGPVAMRLGVG